jgi:hypothetical protein
MRTRQLSLATAFGVGIAALGVFASAQQPTPPPCLHGENETQPQVARRQAALTMTRQINTLEFGSKTGFVALEQLPLSVPIPQGFETRLLTDGKSYAFSVKDTTDRCGFAYFSDSYQDGRIYVGQGIK